MKFLVVVLFFLSTASSIKNFRNSTLSRNKRSLIYNNGAQMRFIAGYLGPIDIPTWQNINFGRNFLFQFNLPDKILTIYNKFPNKRSYTGGRFLKGDSTRKIAYSLVERLMSK